MNKIISIISPVYNALDDLKKTYSSILVQNKEQFLGNEIEWIIMDGNSTDGTKEKAQYWQKKHDFIFAFSESDDGIYDAMNKGVAKANGEYVIFLGAGDVFSGSGVLRKLLLELRKHKPDVLYGWSYMVDGEVKKPYLRRIDRSYCFRADPISHQAIIARKKLLKDYPFQLKYKVAADQDWIMHTYKFKNSFRFIDMPICDYDIHGFSATEEGKRISTNEIQEIHRKYYPSMWFLHTVLRFFNKKIIHYNRNQ